MAQDVTGELAGNAPLSVTVGSARGLAYAGSGRFSVRECHLELEGRGACLKLLRLSALAPKLASVTLSDWSVVKEEVLQYIQDACAEGALRFPSLLSCAGGLGQMPTFWRQVHVLACPPPDVRSRAAWHSGDDYACGAGRCRCWVMRAPAPAGAFPKLARMRFRRVVPAQHMLPEQVTAVELADIRPPYGSSPGTGSGLFYLVRAPCLPLPNSRSLRRWAEPSR